ncbi:Gfo/Idh/MocA family protein [Paenibacillus solisilvae]|uniref:Gfo/Idh/MocA family protein n=1 Tax=Paenibacillus solisilvae TaxID=2486751 RepID=A0ABW0W521_9BACL
MKKYAIVGTGSRALHMFAKPMFTELKDDVQLVGVYDINLLRAKLFSQECGDVPVYPDFDKMLKEGEPDTVIVATVDQFHHEYIIRALNAGCDVISEKPLTTDAEKCRAILEAEQRTGRKVAVTFNCRYIPYVARIKELIKEGAVGDILSIHFEWNLDTRHGADYYRRWHRSMANSGGLLIHKATHHFDMLNWWLEEDPEEINAFGSRRFYGPTRENRGERCLTCSHSDSCEFYFDITADEFAKTHYYEVEAADGYIRDQCVFGDDIDIYDTMAVNVRYSGGALLTYSLNAHSPYEGWKVSINGSLGKIEAQDIHSGLQADEPTRWIQVYNRKGEQLSYAIEKSGGAHGGGDERLRRMIFVGDVADPLGQQAGTHAGAMSMLIGAAANLSIVSGKPVTIKELLHEPKEETIECVSKV